MKLKRFFTIILAFVFISAILIGCTKTGDKGKTDDDKNVQFELVTAKSVSDMFTDRDTDFSFDEKSAVKITLNKNKIKADSKNVTVKKAVATITAEGVYVIDGSLTNGQIVVDADSSDKIQLVLNNVNINCNTSAPIYIKSASKTFVTLNKNTKNTLSVKNEFKAIDENKIDSAIFSKNDLTLNGDGALTITCSYGHGVVSKKDLKITSGTYNISSKKHALQANYSIRIADGSFDFSCEKDGLNCNYDGNKSDKGFVFISGGTLNINAGDDGIHASDSIQILNGDINITKCNEGIESESITVFDGNISVVSDDDAMNATSKDNTTEQTENPFSVDENAIINIYGGNINLKANGDGIDSNGNVNITGGQTFVEGPEDNGNSALDYSGVAIISSGIFVATGSTGMAQGFSDSSSQCSIFASLTGDSGDTVSLKDKNDNEIISYKPSKKFTCVVISHPDIAQGSEYTLSSATDTKTIKMKDIVYSDVSSKMNGQHKKDDGFMRGKGDKDNKNNKDNKDMIPPNNNSQAPDGEIPSGDPPADMPQKPDGMSDKPQEN